ncbi:MAG: hypothetical protein ACYSU7_16285 [Planctomycetota bacterium]|jgi:hypothetical protein
MSTAIGRTRRPGRTLTAATIALAVAYLAGCSGSEGSKGFLGIQFPSSSQDKADEKALRQQRQMEVFDRTVRNPSADIDPEIRRQAAEEMIAMDLPDATARLAEALGSGEPTVELAVIDAMESAPEPVEGLLPAAVATLQDASGPRLDKLSLVLPRYGEPALNRVAVLARDQSEPPARRLGPIYALASFRSRDSAVQLMVMMDEQRNEPPEVVAATGASLERLTGLPYGSDASQWRRWWDKLKDEPIESWLRIMVMHLSTKTSELEHEIHQRDRESEAIAERLATALRDMFLMLSVEDQLARLPDLLDDELAPVRAFALGRVERRLRDSERIPESVQQKLAERLTDSTEQPTSRLLAARLLNDLNYQPTADMVAAVLAVEKDPEVARGYLEILARRSTPEALDLMLLWLDDSTAGEAAADATWAVILNGTLDRSDVPTVRRAARRAYQWRATPAHVRLLGAIGEDRDLELVVQQVEAGEPAMRRAAAEGLAFAGHRDPLLEHVRDEEVYPFAIRLVARGPNNIDTLRALAELAPPESHRQEWTQAVKEAADRLAPADLIEVDTILESLPHVDRQLRADVLARIVGLPPDTLTEEQLSALAARLVTLRIDLGDYQGAYDVVTRNNGAMPSTPALRQLAFKAAVLSGHYDDAAAIDNDPRRWVLLYDELTAQRPQAAGAVGEEIQRRFPDKLEGDVGELFRVAEERLTQATASADPSRTGPSE